MGALKFVTDMAGNSVPKKEEVKKKKEHSELKNAFHAFGDWVTSPGGIVTIAGFAFLVWLIFHRTEAKK